MDSDGVLCVSEGAVNGLSARVSLLDKRGNVLARWDANSAHGSWIDGHGDIYMALGAMERVDKGVTESSWEGEFTKMARDGSLLGG